MKSWCYWNLNKNCVSFKLGSGGRVSHATTVTLSDVKFHVLETGRQKVLKERCKNVHSYLIGNLDSWVPLGEESEPTSFERLGFRQAYYNPYTTPQWVDWETKSVLHVAKNAVVVNKTVWYTPF